VTAAVSAAALGAARRRPGPALAVLLGHALLLLGVWQALLPVRPQAAARGERPLMVWLRAAAAAPPGAARVPAPATTRQPPKPAGPPRDTSPVPAVTAPAMPAPAGPPIGWLAPAREAAAPPPPAASRPLDLRWQPALGAAPRAIDLVRQAPAHSETPDRDARLAQTLGTDTSLREEDRGAVRRFRRGSTCVDTRATRESQINPFGAAAGMVPRLVEPC